MHTPIPTIMRMQLAAKKHDIMTLDEHADFILAAEDSWDITEPSESILIIEGVTAEGNRFFSFQINCAAQIMVLYPDGMGVASVYDDQITIDHTIMDTLGEHQLS